VADFVGAVDQGTTSSRFMIFDHAGNEVGRHQLEHEQILPRAGWVEHSPVEIWERTSLVIQTTMNGLGLVASDLAALGITNQRETTVVWNKKTGRPYHNAIVWQDTRTDRIASALEREGKGDVIRQKAGLPPATYFSGGKIQWILENVPGARADAETGDALFGNTDSWVMWNLTGGVNGGVHVTDVTNASRTMLMNLETLDWDEELLGFFDIPRSMLPQIRPSSDAVRGGGSTCAVQGHPHHRYPRRPAGGHVRTGLFRPGRGEEHLRHRQLPVAEHRHRTGPQQQRATQHRLLPVRHRQTGLRPGRLDRRDRIGGAVAARSAGHHLRRS